MYAFSAKGAVYSASAWGSAPGGVEHKKYRSAEGAIHFRDRSDSPRTIEARFQRWFIWFSNSWGDAPGSHEERLWQ
jgi:hypothetical protein